MHLESSRNLMVHVHGLSIFRTCSRSLWGYINTNIGSPIVTIIRDVMHWRARGKMNFTPPERGFCRTQAL